MNEHEIGILDVLKRRGYEVLRTGWPDFLVSRTVKGHLLFAGIEVKSLRDFVSEEQIRMHRMLESFGLPVNVLKQESPQLGPPGINKRLRHAILTRIEGGNAIQLVEWRLGDRSPVAGSMEGMSRAENSKGPESL
ncbi:MAG: hypothetical protein JWN63_2293 [Candidatus Acidoferrum typicum]|nr:hypothetical protein [Candidatus Acidoferrum typicum]